MPSKIDIRHKKIGGNHRALSRYYMICNRVNNTGRSKNRGYLGIEVRVLKAEFVEWFMSRDFKGCSVDRIDKTGHYELSNMQVISLVENIVKDKLIARNGMCRCFICKQIKPIEDFSVDRRRVTTGRTTCCKSCDSKRTSNESQEARDRRLASMRDYYRRTKSIRSEKTYP